MYRVLLVDDEVIIRENVSRHVPWNEHGFELVSSCQNGQEAADYITSNPVDLLITDICMPFMDGMELCEYVHQHFPHIKIVLLSVEFSKRRYWTNFGRGQKVYRKMWLRNQSLEKRLLMHLTRKTGL